MELVFLSQKGSEVGRGVKESITNASNLEGVKDGVVPSVTIAHGNTQKDLNDDPVAMEVQSLLVDQTNAVIMGGGSYPPLPTQGTTSARNTLGKSSYANVIGESSKKAVNIRTLFTPGGTGLILLCRWSRSELLAKGLRILLMASFWVSEWLIPLLVIMLGTLGFKLRNHGLPVTLVYEDILGALPAEVVTCVGSGGNDSVVVTIGLNFSFFIVSSTIDDDTTSFATRGVASLRVPSDSDIKLVHVRGILVSTNELGFSFTTNSSITEGDTTSVRNPKKDRSLHVFT
ncbi:hypothetical protein Tco_1091383 [Tanacetum coccineum]|uniref:Uncharacterized protein n=1 Tax=Tanacetum coccineum TaxID=301880 RepID=A0ABQ5I876_9ASTR